MSVPTDLLYSREHEWVKVDGDVATVGITDYAQESLGDIVYVELPKIGSKIDQFSTVGVVESVKAVSDLFTPIGGEVLEVNADLDNDPAAVNRDAYSAGWMMKIRMSDSGQTAKLLQPAEYNDIINNE